MVNEAVGFQVCGEDGAPIDPSTLPLDELQAVNKAIMSFMEGTIDLNDQPPPTSVAQAAEYTHKLGTHNLPNQYRTHKHGTFDWRVESRWQKKKVSAVFKHPTMSDFVNAAVSCVGVSAVGSAVLAAATSNPAAGLAIFVPGWKACMLTKVSAAVANDIKVDLKVETITGPWSGH